MKPKFTRENYDKVPKVFRDMNAKKQNYRIATSKSNWYHTCETCDYLLRAISFNLQICSIGGFPAGYINTCDGHSDL